MWCWLGGGWVACHSRQGNPTVDATASVQLEASSPSVGSSGTDAQPAESGVVSFPAEDASTGVVELAWPGGREAWTPVPGAEACGLYVANPSVARFPRLA